MSTPSEEVRVAVQEALDLSKYAAAPFFGSQVRQRDDDGEVSYIWATTPEWWAGLQELIERVQPMLQDALAALSLHVGDASDGQSDALGASASPTACSGPSAPEPQSVSALRVPPAGAGGESERWVSVERMLPECDVRVLVYEERDGTVCLDWLVADEQGEPNYWQNLGYGPYTFVTHWMPLPAPPEAQAIVTREGGDPSWAPSPKAIERGPEGARPEVHITPGYVVTGGHFVESRAQPSPHIEPERAAFEARFPGCVRHREGDDYLTPECMAGWEAWEARAASATTPTEGPAQDRAQLIQELKDMHHDLLVAMQAAWIEWRRGGGADKAMEWIEYTLDGPGLIPDESEPYSSEAQAYFDANRAHPFPTCFCGRPSNNLWMGQGFCSTEHYREAKVRASTLTDPEGAS